MTPLTRANVRLATDEPPARNAVCVRLPQQLARRLLSSSRDGASPSVEIELDPGDTTRTPAAFVVDGTPYELSATAVSEIDLLGPDDAPLGATRLVMRVKPTLDGASLRQKQPRPESIVLDAAITTSKKVRTRKATTAMKPVSTSAAKTAAKPTAAKARKSTTQATISGGAEVATSSTRAVLRASAACKASLLEAIVDGCIHLLALSPLTKESLESSLSPILANSGVHATPTQLRFAMSSALKKVADVPAASGEKYSLLPDLYSRASRSWPHYSQAQRNTLSILQQKRSEAARGAAAREHASESLAPYDLTPGTRIDVQWGTDGWYAATVVRSRVTQHKRRITTVRYDEADQGGNVYEHDLEESPFRLHSSRTMPPLPPPPPTAAVEATRVPAPQVPSPDTPIPRMTISTLDGYEAAKRRFDSLYSKYSKLDARLAKRTLHYESLARKLSAEDIPVAERHQDANKIVRQFQAERDTWEATSQEYHELHIELRQIKEAVNEYVASINECATTSGMAEVGDRT